MKWPHQTYCFYNLSKNKPGRNNKKRGETETWSVTVCLSMLRFFYRMSHSGADNGDFVVSVMDGSECVHFEIEVRSKYLKNLSLSLTITCVTYDEIVTFSVCRLWCIGNWPFFTYMIFLISLLFLSSFVYNIGYSGIFLSCRNM